MRRFTKEWGQHQAQRLQRGEQLDPIENAWAQTCLISDEACACAASGRMFKGHALVSVWDSEFEKQVQAVATCRLRDLSDTVQQAFLELRDAPARLRERLFDELSQIMKRRTFHG